MAVPLAGHRQLLDLTDRRKWERLTGHRRANLTDHRQVNRTGRLQRRA